MREPLAREEDPDDAALLQAMSAMRALAALLPEADFSVDAARRVVRALNADERRAVDEFAREGQRCLATLRGMSLEGLRELSAGGSAIAQTRGRAAPVPTGRGGGLNGAMRNVYQVFREYDANHDGLLDLAEFKAAFKAMAGDTKFSDAQLEAMAKAADASGDGLLDIHEFAVWLSGGHGAGSKDTVESLQCKLETVERELSVKSRAMARLEDAHEEEMDATHDFWREIAKHAVLTIDQKVNLKQAVWLGNGKYGFVLKATRRKDDREVVVKMMGLRWAHLAAKEWQCGHLVGSHPNIVEYEEVMLHADNDSCIQRLLQAGYESGVLKSRTKRSQFPARYICLTVELMNRGTVQDWLDRDLLLPSGLLCVMRDVARALAYMHAKGFAHNDIKPENVMLHEPAAGAVEVKLGDLGLACKSEDPAADFWQYGMTALCMLTGERFGARKYREESIDEFVGECRQALTAAETECGELDGALAASLHALPPLLDAVFRRRESMQDVASAPELAGWGFLDSDWTAPAAGVASPASRRMVRATSRVEMESLLESALRGEVSQMGAPQP